MVPRMNLNFEVKTGRPVGSKIARKSIREKEYNELIAALDNANFLSERLLIRHRRAFMLLYNLGLRVGELLILRVKDIRQAFETGESQLEGSLTKTKKARLLQFSDNARTKLYQIFGEVIENKTINENYYLFHSPTNPFRPLNKANFTLLMNEFIHNNLGENFSTHSFRQGLISDMVVKHQLPIVVAQSFIGHSSVMTTARYTRATEEDTFRAINVVR